MAKTFMENCMYRIRKHMLSVIIIFTSLHFVGKSALLDNMLVNEDLKHASIYKKPKF